MGLDAVVYRNRKNLSLGLDAKHARLEPATGEVYFEDDKTARRHQAQITAAAHRIGNIAVISALREEAAKLIGPQSLIVTKLFYSGTHSGDFIPLRELQALSQEASKMADSEKKSPQLQHFLTKLEDLIRVAQSEANPIVFR